MRAVPDYASADAVYVGDTLADKVYIGGADEGGAVDESEHLHGAVPGEELGRQGGLGEGGVRAVGVDLIVKESGIAKTSLYRHFANKDALVAAFLAGSTGYEVAGRRFPANGGLAPVNGEFQAGRWMSPVPTMTAWPPTRTVPMAPSGAGTMEIEMRLGRRIFGDSPTATGDEARARQSYGNALRAARGEAPTELGGRDLRQKIHDSAVIEERDEHGMPRLRG